jgi:hypothetical protein
MAKEMHRVINLWRGVQKWIAGEKTRITISASEQAEA